MPAVTIGAAVSDLREARAVLRTAALDVRAFEDAVRLLREAGVPSRLTDSELELVRHVYRETLDGAAAAVILALTVVQEFDAREQAPSDRTES